MGSGMGTSKTSLGRGSQLWVWVSWGAPEVRASMLFSKGCTCHVHGSASCGRRWETACPASPLRLPLASVPSHSRSGSAILGLEVSRLRTKGAGLYPAEPLDVFEAVPGNRHLILPLNETQRLIFS